MTEDFSQKALVWRLWYWMIRQRSKIFRQLCRKKTDTLDDCVTGWLSHWMTESLDDWVTGWMSHWMTESLGDWLLTHTNTYWHTLTHTDMYWHILTRTDMYWHVLTRTDTYWHILTCNDTDWHLPKLPDIYWQPIITRRPNSQKGRTQDKTTVKPNRFPRKFSELCLKLGSAILKEIYHFLAKEHVIFQGNSLNFMKMILFDKL